MGLHIRVAAINGLAGSLIQDVGRVLVGAEEPFGPLEKVGGTLLPALLASIVGQDSGAVEVYTTGVGVRVLGDFGAVVGSVGAIVDMPVVVVDEADIPGPVPDLLGPLEMGLVAGGASEAGRDLEEPSIANRVLVVHAVGVVGVDLPSEAAAAVSSVPAALEGVEDVLANLEPRGERLLGLGKVSLGGGEGGRAPKVEIIIAFLALVLRGHIVVVRTQIGGGQKSLDNDIVVAGVLGVVVVVEQSSPKGTRYPPVVWIFQISNLLEFDQLEFQSTRQSIYCKKRKVVELRTLGSPVVLPL